MYTNWFLAILVEKKVIDKETATDLAKALDSTTYSHDFTDALADIKRILIEIQDKQLHYLAHHI